MAPKNKGGDKKGKDGGDSNSKGGGKGLKPANAINVRHILVRISSVSLHFVVFLLLCWVVVGGFLALVWWWGVFLYVMGIYSYHLSMSICQ